MASGILLNLILQICFVADLSQTPNIFTTAIAWPGTTEPTGLKECYRPSSSSSLQV